MSDHVHPAAAALLQPRLDAGETLVWAERPDNGRMLLASTRAFFSTPLHWAPPFLLAGLLIWRLQSANDPSPLEWAIIAVMLFPVLTMAVDLLAILFVVLPTFVPLAYGATRSYFVVYRGLLVRRLFRLPVSTVRRVELVRWGGRDTLVFRMDAGEKAPFSFLHASDPAAALARIEAAVPLPQGG